MILPTLEFPEISHFFALIRLEIHVFHSNFGIPPGIAKTFNLSPGIFQRYPQEGYGFILEKPTFHFTSTHTHMELSGLIQKNAHYYTSLHMCQTQRN